MSTKPSLNETLDHLLEVLDREKALLLAGQYDKLAEVAKDKEHSVADLDRLLVDQNNVKQLSAYMARFSKVTKFAQENEQLLNAARGGVSSAQVRIKNILNRSRNVGVYSLDGNKPLVPDAGITRGKMA